MKKRLTPTLHLALIHHPVRNKNGEEIISAVTNLDLHDISRVAKTYGVFAFYVVTPLIEQQELVEKILKHWLKGHGASYNPIRKKALELIQIRQNLNQVVAEIKEKSGKEPKLVATCARKLEKSIGFSEFREKIVPDVPYLLLFGTAWGLTTEFLSKADFILEPIQGVSEYNHLSVRSAVSIILDRLVSIY